MPTFDKSQHLIFPIYILALSNVILSNLRFLYIMWMCKWCILLFVCLQYRYGLMYLLLQVCHVLEKVHMYLNVSPVLAWILFRSFVYLNLEWLNNLLFNCDMWIYIWDTALYCCVVPMVVWIYYKNLFLKYMAAKLYF